METLNNTRNSFTLLGHCSRKQLLTKPEVKLLGKIHVLIFENYNLFGQKFHNFKYQASLLSRFEFSTMPFRLQREEIRQKQEKLDSILKKKKNDSARPESPGGTRRRVKRPLLHSRRLIQTQPRSLESSVGPNLLFLSLHLVRTSRLVTISGAVNYS